MLHTFFKNDIISISTFICAQNALIKNVEMEKDMMNEIDDDDKSERIEISPSHL